MHSVKAAQRRKAHKATGQGIGSGAADDIDSPPVVSQKKPTPATKTKKTKAQHKKGGSGTHWADSETSKMLDCVEDVLPTGNMLVSILCRFCISF